MLSHRFEIALLTIALSACARVQAQAMLVNANPDTQYGLNGFRTSPWLEEPGAVWFWCHEFGRGTRLWRTDGQASGTSVVLDPVPGRTSSGEDYLNAATGVVLPNGKILTVLRENYGTGAEPWVSDRTPAGTRILADLDPGTAPSDLAHTIAEGGRATLPVLSGRGILLGRTSTNKLWTTDGVSVVEEHDLGTSTQRPQRPVLLNGRIVFAIASSVLAYDGNNVVTLASSGVTTNIPLTQHVPILGNYAFFPNYVNSQTIISRTDGVTFVQASTVPGAVRAMSTAGNGLVFYIDGSGSRPTGIYATDALGQNPTILLATTVTGGGYETPHRVGHRVILTASTGDGVKTSWITDGTVAGTQLLRDASGGQLSPYDAREMPFGAILFQYTINGNGSTIYRTDGTPSGTVPIYSSTASLGPIGRLGSECLFIDQVGTQHRLMATDGTTGGIRVVYTWGTAVDTAYGIGAYNRGYFDLQGRLLYNPPPPSNGGATWGSDGTSAGTRLINTLGLGLFFGVPGVVRGGAMEFGRDNGRVRFQSLSRSGTIALPGLTTHLSDGFHWSVDRDAQTLLLSGVDVLTAGTSNGLWTVTDTSATLTYQPTAPTEYVLGAYRHAGMTCVIVFQTNAAGASEIRRVDPTGTVSVWREPSTAFTFLGHSGSRIILAGNANSRTSLWSTDGTPGGTQRLAPSVGVLAGRLRWAQQVGDLVYVAADLGGGAGVELWCTDGTATGTFMVGDPKAGAGSEPQYPLVPVGDCVLYAANGDGVGWEIYKAQARPNSVRLVRDVYPGLVGGATYDDYLVSTQTLYGTMVAPYGNPSKYAIFVGRQPTTGSEIWISDGSLAGTRMLFDLIPGVDSRMPMHPITSGKTLFMWAHDQQTGRELWATDVATVGLAYTAADGSGCAGSAGKHPSLVATEPPEVGAATFGYRVSAALPNSGGALLVGIGRTALALNSVCTAYPDLSLPNLFLGFALDGSGAATIPFPLDAAWQGIELNVQALILDPNGAYASALAFSNGVYASVGR